MKFPRNGKINKAWYSPQRPSVLDYIYRYWEKENLPVATGLKQKRKRTAEQSGKKLAKLQAGKE